MRPTISQGALGAASSLAQRKGCPHAVDEESCGLGSSDSLPTGYLLFLFLVWTQDICLKMAFMKSVVQVTNAIKNVKNLEDFEFAQKMTLTGIIIVSRVGGFLAPGRFWGPTADWLLLGQRFSESLRASEGQGGCEGH